MSSDTETEKIELEDQFILRLPLEHAKRVHEILKTKPEKLKKCLKISLNLDENFGYVYVGHNILQGKFKKLPTVVDSYKTNICNNKSNLTKTADVAHLLDCKEELEEDAKLIHPHGLTPPLKNVRKNRFRKTLRNSMEAVEVEHVAKELFYLFRADYEAVATRYEIIYEDNSNLLDLFGHVSSDSEDSDKENKPTAADASVE